MISYLMYYNHLNIKFTFRSYEMIYNIHFTMTTHFSRNLNELKRRFYEGANDSRYSSYGKVANGLVVYIPDGFKVLQSEYDPMSTELLYKKMPHVVMIHHYERNLLQIPGGKVENSETYLEAVNREFSEEVFGLAGYLPMATGGKPVFRDEDYIGNTKAFGTLQIAHFIRVIYDPVVYMNLVEEASSRYVRRLLPSSTWVSKDSFGIFSMPIFMEDTKLPVYRTPGLPMCLDSVHQNHRDTLLLLLMYPLECLGDSIMGIEGGRSLINRMDVFKTNKASRILGSANLIRIMCMVEESREYIEKFITCDASHLVLHTS